MALDKSRPIFGRGPFDKNVYKWQPQTDVTKKRRGASTVVPECTAEAGSQGEDWVGTYVYKIELIGVTTHRFAYVECDYVK